MQQNIWIKPHRDDDWCDELKLFSQDCRYSFRIYLEERYKTSELTGNQWRWSAVCEVRNENKNKKLEAIRYGGLQAAFSFFPRLLGVEKIDETKISPQAQFTCQWLYKGSAIAEAVYSNLIEAMVHIPGTWFEVPETSDISDTILNLRAKHCSHPGCAEEPVSLFLLKKQYDSSGDEEERSTPAYRHFCRRHLLRGDASWEDSDENYQLVQGVHPSDSAIDPQVVSRSRQVVVGLRGSGSHS